MQDLVGSAVDIIGDTPLLQLHRMDVGLPGRVLAKCESFNPGRSVKDRIAVWMIRALEDQKVLHAGSVLVEPTSGNTGIGLALVCAVRGYHLVLTMPETMSVERRQLMAAYGAEIVLTPGAEGMRGAVRRAEQIAADRAGVIPSQFTNPANPEAHELTTAEEIWAATGGAIDIFVAGVGTGGTLTGVARALKPRRRSLRVVAVEPADSDVLSGGLPGPHTIQGIGAGFIPSIVEVELIDEVFRVTDTGAIETARRLAREEGILAGVSSGAALHAALAIAARPTSAGLTIVTILPDTGERYLSSGLFEE